MPLLALADVRQTTCQPPSPLRALPFGIIPTCQGLFFPPCHSRMPGVERLSQETRVPPCRIGGKCAAFRAKTVEVSGHLPFTTFNSSRTRCEAVFPGNEASISIFQIIFPSFSAKSVHSSVNLPARGEKRENGMSMGAKIGPLIMSIFLLDFARDACWPVQHAP